jgi:exoribonuclease R
MRVRAGAGPDDGAFREVFARIRQELEVPGPFPDEVIAEAAASAASGPVVPPGSVGERTDLRDVPFVTIDPAGSRDLDQAFFAERTAKGYRVRYAIADVAAFVRPGGALDRATFARGVTYYLPDGRAPLHPEVLGEGAASLLPDGDRPAVVWTIELDREATTGTARLERATVRTRAALAFGDVQAALDAGTAEEPLLLLREVGGLRQLREQERGGVSLNIPSQEVDAVDGGFALTYETPMPVEGWNAQISLLAGVEAAGIMIDARVGILRTLPPPADGDIAKLRRIARALRVPWPEGTPWPEVVRALDRARHDHAAFLVQATRLLRGAGYVALDETNTAQRSSVPQHAGVGAPYAHVTAPLRRLSDRYANEIVLARCAGVEPPEWATSGLAGLAKQMEAVTRHAAAVERAVVDAAECIALTGHEGERFEGVVVDRRDHGAVVQLADPAVVAGVDADLDLGAEVIVRLVSIDPVARRLEFSLDEVQTSR